MKISYKVRDVFWSGVKGWRGLVRERKSSFESQHCHLSPWLLLFSKINIFLPEFVIVSIMNDIWNYLSWSSTLSLPASRDIKKLFFRNEGLKNAAQFLLCCGQYFYFILPRKGIQCCDLNVYDFICLNCLFLYFFDNPWKSQYWNKLNLLGPRGCLCVSKVNINIFLFLKTFSMMT